MGNDRSVRWQATGRAQFSVIIALLSGLSVAGLTAGLTLLQNDKFQGGMLLGASLFFFLCAIFTAIATEVSRLLDFKLTARKVMKSEDPEYVKPLTIMGSGPNEYGNATWRLLLISCTCFAVAAIFLVYSIALGYGGRM